MQHVIRVIAVKSFKISSSFATLLEWGCADAGVEPMTFKWEIRRSEIQTMLKRKDKKDIACVEKIDLPVSW